MTPFVPLGHVLEAPATRPEREAQEAVAWIIHDREDEYHGRGSDTVRFSPLLPEEEDAGLTASPLYREPPDAAATIARLQRERAAAIGLLDGQAHIIKTLETKASRLRGALKAAKAEEREACAQIAASVASRCAERGVTMAKSRTGKDKARAGHRASVEIELAIRARAETISEVD